MDLLVLPMCLLEVSQLPGVMALPQLAALCVLASASAAESDL